MKKLIPVVDQVARVSAQTEATAQDLQRFKHRDEKLAEIAAKSKQIAAIEAARTRLETKRHPDRLTELAAQLADHELENPEKALPKSLIEGALLVMIRQSLHLQAFQLLGYRRQELETQRRELGTELKQLDTEIEAAQAQILGEAPAPKQAPPAQTSDTADFERLSVKLGGSVQTVRG